MQGTQVFIILTFAPRCIHKPSTPRAESHLFHFPALYPAQISKRLALLSSAPLQTHHPNQQNKLPSGDTGRSRRWKKCRAAWRACSAAPQPLCCFLTPSETLSELLLGGGKVHSPLGERYHWSLQVITNPLPLRKPGSKKELVRG